MSDLTNNLDEMTVEVVTFQDDDGNEFDMEIVEEFEHAGRKFAVLAEVNEEEHEHEEGESCGTDGCASCAGCGGGEEEALYIFEIVTTENGEEFLPVDDDNLLDELSTVVEDLLFEEE